MKQLKIENIIFEKDVDQIKRKYLDMIDDDEEIQAFLKENEVSEENLYNNLSYLVETPFALSTGYYFFILNSNSSNFSIRSPFNHSALILRTSNTCFFVASFLNHIPTIFLGLESIT